MSPEARIAASTMTLDQFERGGIASVENVLLIREEMRALDDIGDHNRILAPHCRELVARWQRYLIRMKTGH